MHKIYSLKSYNTYNLHVSEKLILKQLVASGEVITNSKRAASYYYLRVGLRRAIRLQEML